MWLVGLVSIISALSPSIASRLRLVTSVLPDSAPTGARVATVAVGAGTLLLAHGLRRRKRRAWQTSVVLTGVVSVLHLVKGFDVEEATLSLAVLALLLSTRNAFGGAPDPRSARHSVLTFVGSSATALAVGTAVLMVDRDGRLGAVPLATASRQAAAGLVARPVPGMSNEAATSLTLLAALVLVATLVSLLRPAGGPHALRPDEETRLRALLDRQGRHDSLGYFALRREKSVVFSPSGKAAVAYRVVGGVSLAAGDPIGDPEAWPGAVESWLAEARRFAWTPAVLGASQRAADTYHRAGLDAWELGDEAVLETSCFTLEGRGMRTVRQAANRVRRLGYVADITPVERLTAGELDEIIRAAERWRSGSVERGFSMALGRLGDPTDSGCVVARVRDAESALVALLHLVPWGPDGLSLDVMRRCPDCDNGVIELVVTELMASAPGLGVARVSLNFAVFRSVFDRAGRLGAGPVLRMWHAVLLRASRVWQLESLYRANAKYEPQWRPRYLCFPIARDLPRVLVAAMQAEAFLPRPRLRPARTSTPTAREPTAAAGAPHRARA